MVWQKTPDGGESQFWYDRLGRLVLSQNAVQYAKSGVSQKIYSYTIYDELGRINEVGEISNRAVNNDSLIGTLAYFDNWLSGSTARSQITKTYYDYPITQKIYIQFVNTGQRNLRGRVSSICYYNAYTSNDTANYTRATHYSYDIHGNVDHLIHDFPEMEQLGHRFKHLVYDYDLISGKVHSVAYQPGQTDRWFHRYDYDADNRIVLAETSLDSVIWDKDAEYEYYKHGPMSRVILGEHGVQGVDYAYTIHGWIKGVNSASLVAGRDIGKDGYGNLRKYTARDAYGYTLGYYNDNTGGAFDGDYKSIGTTSFEVNKTGSPIASANKNLYNGNISHMVSNVSVLMPLNNNSPLATVYKYDQLNRIKSVRTYNSINLDSNKWSSGSLSNSWNESFDFDANGNITQLQRYGASTVMDKLNYNYKSGTNQLRSVDDTVSVSTYLTDIDDQDVGNYRYDKIGNLTHDEKEEIDSIYWNVYGKISKIVRRASSSKPSLEFEYDAMGQRVLKIVKKGPIEKDWDYTWYVRDAQGSIMATYNKKNILKNSGDTSIYRKINNSIVSQYNADSLAEFIKYFYKGSQVISSLGAELVGRSLLDEFTNGYHADSILNYDSAYAEDVLKYLCDYVSSSTDRRDLLLQMLINQRDSIIEMIGKGCFNMNDLIARVLTYDGASDELLNALATLDISRFDLIYQSLGAPPPPPIPTLVQKITFIRSNSNLSISNSINNQFSVSELETIIKGMTASIIDSVIMNLDGCELNTNISNCSFDYTWFNFIMNQIDNDVVKTIILGTSEPNYLSSLLIEKDRLSVNKIANLEKDIIADVLRNESSVDLMVYLSYIYKRFGREVFNQILEDLDGDLTLKKDITLNELHIYGSSRHGIAKPNQLLCSKTYEITEVSEEGGFGSIGFANDSTISSLNYSYFRRTLTRKQYELTNHLGNVLATILDRKTAITDSLGGDTLKYYISDVSTAQYYYAYGSALPGLQFNYADDGDTSKYRFGFNNQEQDSELGDYYAFEYRIHDARLGRFLSVDPLGIIQPFTSNYSFAWNQPIWAIDAGGMIRIIVTFVTHSGGRNETVTVGPSNTVYNKLTLDEINGKTYTDVHITIHQYEIGVKVGNIPAYYYNILFPNTPGKKYTEITGGLTLIEEIYNENWVGGFFYEMTMKNWPVAKWTQALAGKDALTNESLNAYERTAKVFEGALDLISYGEGKTLGSVLKDYTKEVAEDGGKMIMDKMWELLKQNTKIDAKTYMKLAYGMIKLGKKYALKDEDIKKVAQLIKPVLEGAKTYADFVNDVYKQFKVDVDVDYQSKDDAVKDILKNEMKYMHTIEDFKKVNNKPNDNTYEWKEN